jgi:hypothetical protein
MPAHLSEPVEYMSTVCSGKYLSTGIGIAEEHPVVILGRFAELEFKRLIHISDALS